MAALGGVLIGLFAGGVLIGLLSFYYVKKKADDARRGWNLVPVVVAAVDMPESTVVTIDNISQRMIPEQFVTSSVVKPESASHVVNQKILVPIQAGDPLYWTQFETRRLPVVLVAAADIPAGATLAEKDVAEKPMPDEVLTPSFVRTEDRPQVVGRSVAAPFRRGDPILWTHFALNVKR
ncbi:MAG TPA: SAF domain-containing protein [Myxococcales bacterium]|jgi:Flp pilus assembly protein CpaB|nr:SAF domain-containing protein [Myxococcales bacterium]